MVLGTPCALHQLANGLAKTRLGRGAGCKIYLLSFGPSRRSVASRMQLHTSSQIMTPISGDVYVNPCSNGGEI